MRFIFFNLTVLCAVGYLIFQNTPVVQDWKNSASGFISTNSPTEDEFQKLKTTLMTKIDHLEIRQQELLAKLEQAPVSQDMEPEKQAVVTPKQETSFMNRNDRRQKLLKLSENMIMKSIEE